MTQVEQVVRPTGLIKVASTRDAGSGSAGFVESLPAGAILLPGARQLSIVFGGAGGDGDTVNYNVWLYDRVLDASRSPTGMIGWSYCNGTATLSTSLGASGNATLSNSERLADTIAAPTETLEAFNESAFGRGLTVYSPANNTPAVLSIGDVGNAVAVFVDTWGTANTFALVNAGQ